MKHISSDKKALFLELFSRATISSYFIFKTIYSEKFNLQA